MGSCAHAQESEMTNPADKFVLRRRAVETTAPRPSDSIWMMAMVAVLIVVGWTAYSFYRDSMARNPAPSSVTTTAPLIAPAGPPKSS
jgi:beta-lactamase regulating signal transducer with metallopeptidase domain